jgi:hypothetical protein
MPSSYMMSLGMHFSLLHSICPMATHRATNDRWRLHWRAVAGLEGRSGEGLIARRCKAGACSLALAARSCCNDIAICCLMTCYC